MRSLGYEVPAEGLARRYVENRELIFSLTSGLLVLIGWLGSGFFAFPAPLSLAFYLAAYVLAGWDISQHAWHAISERHFDTDLLMVLAALGAALLGDFAEGALLLFLFSLGHALEERALDRARSAVRALADLAPKTALVRREGGMWKYRWSSSSRGRGHCPARRAHSGGWAGGDWTFGCRPVLGDGRVAAGG